MSLKIETNWKPLTLCLLTAILVSILQARGMMDERIIPFGDSSAFYQYALTLYGQVHTGQWANAVKTLSEASKNLFPSTTLFLFMPYSYANSTGYGFVNNLSWHLITMAGLWILLRAFGRERLTIPLFLLVCANNYALDPAYYYYMDLPFMGLALLSIAMSVYSLKNPTVKNILISGAAGALPFLAKPPNALINTVLLVMFITGVFATRALRSKQKSEWGLFFRYAGLWAAGFLPVFILSAFCGGATSIVETLYLNEVGNVFYSELTEGGIRRLLYFPFCLTFYYSILLVAGFLACLCLLRFHPRLRRVAVQTSEPEQNSDDKIIFSWMLLIFILFWGLYFSFGIENKLIRSLPLMIPILWILLFAATPLGSLQQRILLPACILFSLFPFMQAESGFIPNKQNRNPETYQINGDWLNRWPSQRPDLAQNSAVTAQLEKILAQSGVHNGKVVVGSQMISWGPGDLNNWCNQQSLRDGHPPAFEFADLCPGLFEKPLQASMEDANALLLILEPRVQYSQKLYKMNVDLTNYAMKNWKDQIADVRIFYNNLKQPSVCSVAFKHPLNGTPLEKLKQDLYGGRFSEKGEGMSSFEKLSLTQKISYLFSKH